VSGGVPPDDEIVARDEDDVLRPVRRPEAIGESLAAVVGRRRWGDRLRGAAIHGRWEEIVGPELAQRCEPVRLAGGILVIRAESTAWATQISYLTGRITERAREVVGEDLVREVKVTVGGS
jgi:predicted nucleic acid-binding Zn ribbon protein